MTDPLYDAGMNVRRQVLGDAHVDLGEDHHFTEPFQDYITRCVWGGIWTRDGLDRKTRSAITLALLTTLGARAGDRHACSRGCRQRAVPDEIAEVLLHTAAYAGVPAANSAFAVGRRVFEEMDAEAEQP